MSQSLPHPTHLTLRHEPLALQVGPPRLGQLLLERGLITSERLDAALDEAQRTGRRLGEVLADRGWLFEAELARALADQNNLRYVDIAATSVDAAAAALLPRELAEQFLAVPVRVTSSGVVLVAVADPAEADIDALRRAIGDEIALAVGDLSAIRNAWRYCP